MFSFSFVVFLVPVRTKTLLQMLTCGAVLDCVLRASLLTIVLPGPPGCDSGFAAWPLPLPPPDIGSVFCPIRVLGVALATGLMLAAGEAGVGAGRVLFMFVLPGATGSSRRLLLRCCICLEIGVFCKQNKYPIQSLVILMYFFYLH